MKVAEPAPLDTPRDAPAVPLPESYEAFFARMLPRAVGAGRRLLGREEAEDVAVEALARAYVDWARLQRLPHRDGWLLRVAANLAYDHLRADERRRRRRPLSAGGAPADSDPEGDGVVLRRSLMPALLRLPTRQREVVVLGYVVGLPHGEIAAVLGCSTGTVKAHLHRALERLRSELGEHWPDET
jgi:RNA polymerase sigma factor (sigma-70 family)